MKKTVVCGALENGGLNMVDLKQMQTAFLLQWVGCLFQAQAVGKWCHIPENSFAPFGDKYLCFFSNLKRRAFKGLQMIIYLSLLELCVKNVARLEQSRPFCAGVNFVMEQQP